LTFRHKRRTFFFLDHIIISTDDVIKIHYICTNKLIAFIMNLFIIYSRVSTARQGESGLSLDAQQSRCKSFAEQNGGEVIAVYSEVESGYKEKIRPQLNAALEQCRRTGATLLIWEMDRLGRRLVNLVEIIDNSGINVIIASNPHMNAFMRNIYAAQAQEESRIRSERTKRALQQKKERGELWDRHIGTQKNVLIMTAARIDKAQNNPYTLEAAPLATLLRERGNSFQKIANQLNKHGYKTPTGKTGKYTPAGVRSLLIRTANKYA